MPIENAPSEMAEPIQEAAGGTNRRDGPVVSPAPPLHVDRPPKLRRDEAVDTIRELILGGEPGFKGGEILSENMLSERLGLTKAPIRQALSQLSGEGLVVILPRVGTQVRMVRPEEAQAILALRFAIETIIVGELTRLRPDLSPLWAIHANMEKIASKRLPRDAKAMASFVKADMAFHAKMAELAEGYSAALRTVNDLATQFFLYALRAIQHSDSPTVMQTVLKEHKKMLTAIAEGKHKEALGHLHDHLKASIKRLTPFATAYVEEQLPKYIRMHTEN